MPLTNLALPSCYTSPQRPQFDPVLYHCVTHYNKPFAMLAGFRRIAGTSFRTPRFED